MSGNPLATAAGLEVLSRVTPEDYAALTDRVARFARGLEEAVAASGLVARAPARGPLVGLYLAREDVEPPTNFVEAKALCDNGLYRPFFHALLSRGVAFAPGAYEILFVSLAHDDDILNRTLEVVAEAAVVAATTA